MKNRKVFESIPCPICRQTSFKIIAEFESEEIQKFAVLLKMKIKIHDQRVVMCSSCEIAYICPRPTAWALKKHYEYFYDGYFKNRDDFFTSAYAQINKVQEDGRLFEIEKYKKSGKILDIGAGPGHFLSVAKKHHWDVYGYEYSKNAALIARKTFNIQLRSGTFSSRLFPNNFFDVITFHSVLEHLTNPLEYIKYAHKKLKPGGLLVLAIPNIASWNYRLSKILHITFPGFIFEHLYYFSPKAISQLLCENFRVIEQTSYHHSRPVHIQVTEHSDAIHETIYQKFFREFKTSKRPLKYIIQRLYFFQMRMLREFFEYSKTGGKFCLGDELIIFALKK